MWCKASAHNKIPPCVTTLPSLHSTCPLCPLFPSDSFPSLLFSLPIWPVPHSIWSLTPLLHLTLLLLPSLTSSTPSCPFPPDNTQEDLSLPWAVDFEAPSSRQCPKNQRVSWRHWLLLCPKTRRKKISGLSFKYCPMQVRQLKHYLWGHCMLLCYDLYITSLGTRPRRSWWHMTPIATRTHTNTHSVWKLCPCAR